MTTVDPSDPDEEGVGLVAREQSENEHPMRHPHREW